MRLGGPGLHGELGRRDGALVLIQQFADVQRERDRQEELKAAGKFSTTMVDHIPDSMRGGFVGEEFGEAMQCVNDLEEYISRKARGVRSVPDPTIRKRLKQFVRDVADGKITAYAGESYLEALERQAQILANGPLVPIDDAIASLRVMLRAEVVQVAALAVGWLEGLDAEEGVVDLTAQQQRDVHVVSEQPGGGVGGLIEQPFGGLSQQP